MTNDKSAGNRRSGFLNADRLSRRDPSAEPGPDHTASAGTAENGHPLAALLEHAIRGSGLHERAQLDPGAEADPQGAAAPPDLLHDKLIEELTTAQQLMRVEPPVQHAEPLDGPEPQEFPRSEPAVLYANFQPSADHPPERFPIEGLVPEALAPVHPEPAPLTEPPPPAAFEYIGPAEQAAAPPMAQEPLKEIGDAEKQPSAGDRSRGNTLGRKVLNLARRMRPKEWNRRRLALLSVIHRHVFDKSTEQLLFCKTPPLVVHHIEETEDGLRKTFFYDGPIPKKLLDWALSALPPDLKRYAFVDFRAGNGRTLLLAARRNFEYAAGYAFDAENTETLEMNLAQYPRSYLTCRDVRALRGDRDGVVIPSQPAVLFFPDSLSAGHLDIILTYVAASLRLDPRPLYLIFENAGRESGKEQMSLFENAPLSLFNKAKAFLFAPASIAVYRSKVEISN